ncbi:MAG TPA: hypothetical protein VG755_25695 [Nannocystaceae bacterium]|nr:hypothetical protein [Nannocystaceae bacterium]
MAVQPGGASRTALWLLAIVAIAALVLLSSGLMRWLAVAALLACVGELAPRLVVPAPIVRPLAWVRARAPLVLLVVVAAALLWPLVVGRPPASRDHAIHYFQARILVDEMLPSGRLSGWTDRLNHGFPYGEGYPTLGYLWVSAAHLLSFGAIDLRTSYAWGLLGVWALSLWGTWRLAALVTEDVLDRLGNVTDPQRVAAWGGCAAALAWLLDPGAARQGGWNYLMFHGVWPQLLSAALWIASLVAIARALRQPSPRRIAIAALLAAGGLLAHPFGLLTIAGSAFAFVVVLAIADDAKRGPVGKIRVVALVHAFALALAFAGLATFLAAAGEMGRSPVAWSELGELTAKLATGDLFAGTWVYAGAFAVVGLGLALWSGRTIAWVAASTAIGMLVLASQDAITVLRLDLLTAAFKNLQFPRFAIALKPLVFAFAGMALVVIVRAAALAWRERAPSPSRTRRLFIAIVLAPLFATLLGRMDALARRPIGAIDTLAYSGHDEDEAALREALRAEDGPLRVAFLRSGMGGGMYPLFAIADAGGAAVLDGHVPTVNFVYVVEKRTPSVLKRLGVTHVIHDRPLGDDEPALAKALIEVGVFGPYTLARLDLEPDDGPRFVKNRGDGVITEVSSGPQSLVLDVDTTGAELSLSRAPSERWGWLLDGEELEPIIASVQGGGLDLLAVQLPHGGRLELVWKVGRAEKLGPWVSGIAALLALVALAFARPLVFAERLHGARALSISRVLLVLTIVLALAWIVRRQSTQLAATWDEYAADRAYRRDAKSGELAFADDLTVSDEIVMTRSDRRACDGLLGRDVLDDCEEGDHRPHPSFLFVDPYIYRCTSFGIPPGDTATVTLGDAGDEVLAFVQRHGGDLRGDELRWSTGAGSAGLGSRRVDIHFRPDKHKDGATLTITNQGDDLEDVCVGAARFE